MKIIRRENLKSYRVYMFLDCFEAKILSSNFWSTPLHYSHTLPKKVRLFRERNVQINPLNTKRRLLYLKTQFVPRSKHFSSKL